MDSSPLEIGDPHLMFTPSESPRWKHQGRSSPKTNRYKEPSLLQSTSGGKHLQTDIVNNKRITNEPIL